MSTPHPGTIVFADETAGTQHERPASEVPESVAWAELAGERVPVTRVVSHTNGDQRTIRSYAADGRLLASTVQVRKRA